jgi:hypothetical protein
MAVCNICGEESFVPGPNGRLTESGAPPQCAGCRSLERQRSLRECLSRVPAEILSWRRAIHFAPDASLDPAWFRSYERSSYGGENSIDLEEIVRPDDCYDFISLSSVLEFVLDDRLAFRELVRVASPTCVIHCTFTPLAAANSHFAEPRGSFGRYHQYGLDVCEWFDTKTHGLTTMVAIAVDPVTEAETPIHFFCRRDRDAELLGASFADGEPAFAVSASGRRSSGRIGSV